MPAQRASVLITGAAGFIGRAVTRRLLAAGCEVIAVDSLHPQIHEARQWPDDLARHARTLVGDVTDAAVWDRLFRSALPEVVIHLAAETATGQSLSFASRHTQTNAVGTAELLDGLTRAGHVPAHFILASSRAVYGEGQWVASDGSQYDAQMRSLEQLEAGRWDPAPPDPLLTAAYPLPHAAHTTAPRPASVYAATKLAQEHLLGAWTNGRGARLTVLRLQNVYGPGQTPMNVHTGILSLFVRLGLARDVIHVYEGGGIVRDFVFVDDVAAAFERIVHTAGSGLTVADVGSGTPATLRDVAMLVAEVTGAPMPALSSNFRPGDVRAAFADITAADKLWDFHPSVDLETGIRRLATWVRAGSRAD